MEPNESRRPNYFMTTIHLTIRELTLETVHLTIRELTLETGNYGIYVTAISDEGEPTHSVELQRGYRSEAEALSALVECLTTAPPDLTLINEAVGHVGRLVDQISDLNQAMQLVGDRLNEVEDKLDHLQGTATPTQVNPLLRPRGTFPKPAAHTAPPPPPAPPPPIRQPRPLIPHQPTGGAFRPGEGGE